MKQLKASIILLILFVMGNNPCFGQNSNDASTLSDVILIKNAYIIESPGMSPIFGSILIDQGLISAVGSVSKIPYNVQIIDADSMYIYAGFIDALSTTGISKPDKKDREKIADPGNPSYEQVGILPNVLSSQSWDASEKSVENMRKEGITVSHSIPHGQIMKGQGAIMTNGTGTPQNMLIYDQVSCNANLKTSRGAYPSTKIGVISKWKELYKQAEYAQGYEQKYVKSKLGLQKPAYDKTLQALYPVINKKQKVFFEAENDLNIYRILALQKELGFDLVLCETKNISDLIDDIKAARAQVLLSIDLPKKEKEDKSETKSDSTSTDVKKDEVKKKEKIDPEVEALKMRKAESIKKYETQAAFLEKANIPFAFSFLEGNAKDLHDNLRRMIEAGLSEKTALAALTTHAANILGIADVAGTISKGKMANLVMTDKPYFEEKSKIKYVYVQGEQFEFLDKPKKDSKAQEGLDISGEWDYKLEIPMPNNTGSMKISKESENNYTFLVTTDEEPDDPETVEDVALDGNNVNFNFDVQNEGGSMNIIWDLNFEEDSFDGTITVSQFGTFPIKGTKTSSIPK